MAGTNPYIKPAAYRKAEQTFRVTFQPSGEVIEVNPADLPFGRTGLPGSILDIALEAGLPVDHACGGVCACSTCHVIIRQGAETCNDSTDDEQDMLDEARGVELNSRLACQCVPDGSRDIIIEIPEWNRNLVKEHD